MLRITAHGPLRRAAGTGIGALAGAALLALVAGCGADTSQADLCERVVDKLYGGPGTTTIVKTEAVDGPRARVAVTFRAANDANGATGTVTCSFASKDGEGRLNLVGVNWPDNRPLHLVSIIFLKQQLRLDEVR